MSNKNKAQNDAILAIRLNEKLLNQLNALATAKGMGTSTMARMVLMDYLRDEAPNALIGQPTPMQPQQPTYTGFNKPKNQGFQLTPEQQQQYEDDWA